METTLLLETERLRLRLPVMADAETIQALVSVPRIAETTLNIPHPYPVDGAIQWVNAVHGSLATGYGRSFVIVRQADNTVMGAISVREKRATLHAEIGYWIGLPYWGQGYMTEAVRRVITYCFDELGLNRVYATHFATNPASGRVMQKAGMQYEGTLRGHVIKWGEPLDLCCYSILRSEYAASQETTA